MSDFNVSLRESGGEFAVKFRTDPGLPASVTPLTVSENGDYDAGEDAAYNPVHVRVPEPISAGAFICTFTKNGDAISCDRSRSEILAAYDSGQVVIGEANVYNVFGSDAGIGTGVFALIRVDEANNRHVQFSCVSELNGLYKLLTLTGTSIFSTYYWSAAVFTFPQGLPEVTTDDNGKFLRVVNGEAAWQTVPGGGGDPDWQGTTLLASGTIPAGTLARTTTTTGVKFSDFKRYNRVVFFRKMTADQGNITNGFGQRNDTGLRSDRRFFAAIFEQIQGYLFKVEVFVSNNQPYMPISDTIGAVTGTPFNAGAPDGDYVKVAVTYFDIRSGRSDFSDETEFSIYNWADLTADINWYLWGM